MGENALSTLLFIWMSAAAAVGIARWCRKTPGTGLVLAYVLNLWMIHWVAPALYLLPWYQNFDPGIVEAGLEQSTYALLTFAFGSLVLTPFILNLGILPKPTAPLEVDANLPRAYVGIGAGSYALLSMGVGAIPSATAIVSTAQQLVVAGLALSCWSAWRTASTRRLIFWIGLTLLLPLVTIVTQGFIGYGAVASLTVLIFLLGFIKRRALVLVSGILLVYLGLSVFVTYMRDRADIRHTVWGGQPTQVRLGQLGKTLGDFEWFDISRVDQLQLLDGRVNQSFLTGLAVSRLSDIGGYARGDTFWTALLALIPRAIWPDKPIAAGSKGLVSEYTGLHFAAGTSVGIGQVMEFYVNFGTLGVVLGFTLMGVLVTTLDRAASERLALNDVRGFVLWYLPGISLLQAGGSLVEVTVSAAASIVVAVLVNACLDGLQRKRVDRMPHSFPPLSSRLNP